MPFGTPLKGHERIQSFSQHVGELEQSQQYKVAKLFEHNCIEYVPVQHDAGGAKVAGGYWLIHPIPGYNKREYRVEACGDGFRCNCQFYRTWAKNAEPKDCTHIGAVYQWCKMRNMAKVPQRVSMGLQMVLEERT
ncbi:MAG: hypothetical protein NT130_03520 [Candidatus Micrarchaeota archaeon]|nr:hypothetical protein [Candidatus Micrarchaeota archaeon]